MWKYFLIEHVHHTTNVLILLISFKINMSLLILKLVYKRHWLFVVTAECKIDYAP